MRNFVKRQGWWIVVVALAGLGFRDWGIPLLIVFIWAMVQVGLWLKNRNKTTEVKDNAR